jgi:hypothetical protein
MKKLINVLALTTVMSFAAFMTGCGGGGSDHDDVVGAGNPPPNNNTATAPASIRGFEVSVTESGGPPRRFTFATDGSSFTVFEGDTTTVVRTGTFDYNAANNTATLTIRDPDGSNQVIYNLNFSAADAGTFTYITPSGQMVSGTFSNLRTLAPGTGTGNTGGGNTGGGTVTDPGTGTGNTGGGNTGGGTGTGTDPGTGTGGGNTGGGTGTGGGNTGGGNTGGVDQTTPPASIAGRTVVFNSTSGPLIGASTATFGPGNTFTSSNTGSGNYTYSLTGNSASLVLDYNAPADFVGDRDTFVMTFNAGSGVAGTFSGSTKIDETESPHGGTFQFQ